MLAFLVRRTENASRFGPPGPKCTRTDFTVTPASIKRPMKEAACVLYKATLSLPSSRRVINPMNSSNTSGSREREFFSKGAVVTLNDSVSLYYFILLSI